MISLYSAAGCDFEALFVTLRPLWRQLKEIANNEPGRPFPAEEFALLSQYGVLALPLPHTEGGAGLGSDPASWPALLRLLRCLGYVSLPVARIYEGHVNALCLLQLYGSAEQQASCACRVRDDAAISGVWNTDEPVDPMILRDLGGGSYSLHGSKVFASGAGWITDPVLTAEYSDRGRQMILLSDPISPDRVDPLSWRSSGMRESASFSVDFTGIRIEADAWIGDPGDYYLEPIFSTGAIRFVAAQLGAAERLAADTRCFLMSKNRHKDPSQLARLSEMAILIESGRQWLDSAWRVLATPVEPRSIQTHVHMARAAVEQICVRVMELAERSIGARGLLEPYSFGRVLADLRMYLRQPFSDRAMLAAGESFCERGYPATDPF